MKEALLVVSMICLFTTFILFLNNLIKYGLKEGLIRKGRRSNWYMMGLFAVYISTFVVFLILKNS
ncbi:MULTISPECIES: hypothetical protein [Pontibacillus]|uniref:Uncharacterized protein n=1 Tax=Pontibacillus chungwhensis TaxID=265426 RepID=A0ABY8V441_9BACI|nr:MULTISPECIES: hypothetical protein [Pontibacillus]MCD5324347.1 hypothetical protein [Pontibacillus sp. HN14]WIF99354.1 hypothetical protein QNI29_06770 [Pontibacillus chungwhensis]